MQGFINRQIPLLLRRAITMAPALIVLAVGVNPTDALVLSQVVLSFGIPFALVPLVLLTRRRDVMGALVNQRAHDRARGWIVAALIISLNVFLLYQTSSADRARYAPADGARRHLPADRRLAARRLDGPRARPADLRRAALHRGGDVPRHLQRPALLEHDWHWRILCAHRFGHAAAAPAVHRSLLFLDEAGIDGELAVREVRAGRAPVFHEWGRPESVREEFRKLAPPVAVAPRRRARARPAVRLEGPGVARPPPGTTCVLTGDEPTPARRRPAPTCSSSTCERHVDGAGARRVDARRRASSARRGRSRFYSHVDVEVRERALAAGFDLVVPRSRMNREGAELVTRASRARTERRRRPSANSARRRGAR